MKQILLALILIAVPVGLFTGFEILMSPKAPVVASLGDLSALKAIVADVDKIANAGDMVAAEKRITDFETAWDDAQPKLQAINGDAWGVVDNAADKAIKALRATTPEAANVAITLTGLSVALDNPNETKLASGGELKVSGIVVSDGGGHALPCEVMVKSLKDSIAAGKIPQANLASANEYMTKALERCNADDDTHADEFSAHGLALTTN